MLTAQRTGQVSGPRAFSVTQKISLYTKRTILLGLKIIKEEPCALGGSAYSISSFGEMANHAKVCTGELSRTGKNYTSKPRMEGTDPCRK